jgi:hypothetical protein
MQIFSMFGQTLQGSRPGGSHITIKCPSLYLENFLLKRQTYFGFSSMLLKYLLHFLMHTLEHVTTFSDGRFCH